jgi:hypothetical protein
VEPLVPGIPFPEAVATLTLPTALTLWQTLAGIEGLRGSAANDWLNIQERMRFISTLFRAHQRNPRLFDPPFTAPQLEQIERGVIPSEFERGWRSD